MSIAVTMHVHAHDVIAIFFQELLMSGLPDIDVEDWETNSEYGSGYDENSDIIKVQWL